MKKNTLNLSIFTLILLGFLGFNTKITNAVNCAPGDLFSTITGQPCNGSQYYNNYNGYNNYTGSQYGVYGNSQYGFSGNFLNQQFQIGSRGAEVFALQQMLNNAGFSVGRIDGIYGYRTDRAFMDYLAQNNNYSNYNNYSYPYQNPYSNPYQNPYPYYNQTPTISGINGPQTLNVNQLGTWTVMVPNISGGNLTYSINWGDQPLYAYGTNNSSVLSPQQSAIFTHTYRQAGTYQPTFTVTSSSGQSASASLSVVVSGATSNITPIIYSLSPTYGLVGTQVTISGTGFGNNSCTTYYCSNGNTTNTVNFGGTVIPNVYSYNGTSLTFTVPSNLNTCYSGQYCTQVYVPVNPGVYPISVSNANGVSNSVSFTVSY